MATPQAFSEIVVRPLAQSDLAEADRIIRLAFGTFLGFPDPERFMGDADYAYTRWTADSSAAFAAERDGKLIGSNFATNWGSFGFFGPLTVHPNCWSQGVAQLLLAPTMEKFRAWGNRHLGLYTFAQSPKHMALYQKFGFWPRDLVAIMAKNLETASTKPSLPNGVSLYSELAPGERQSALSECRELTSAIFPGLDVTNEIRAVAGQHLGDTILLRDGSPLAAFAVCHVGPRTEAGSGVCYAKFAAVRPGPRAGNDFEELLGALEAFASQVGATKLDAGVNLARREAFAELFARGFRTQMQGVAMEAGDASSGYNRAGVYVLDDWR